MCTIALNFARVRLICITSERDQGKTDLYSQ